LGKSIEKPFDFGAVARKATHEFESSRPTSSDEGLFAYCAKTFVIRNLAWISDRETFQETLAVNGC
jgi:hypothetical protein